MVRFLITPVIPLVLLFSAFIALIYDHPHDDSDLQALLFSGDCALPCFMGIRPGITTVQEAYDLLERHPWVDHVKQHIWFSGPNNNLFSWTWSGQQPAFINSAAPGVFSAHGSLVDVVQVSTTIPLGAFWLRRRPQQGLVADEPGEFSYSAVYFDGALEVQTFLFCPLRLEAFWQARTQLQISMYESRTGLSSFQLPGWFHDVHCP